VEAVAADTVPAVQVIRQGVQIGVLRNGGVKRRVKHRNLRHADAEELARGLNALDVVGIVERRQIDAVLDAFKHRVVHQLRFRKQLAAVDHAMAYSVYIAQAADLRDA